MVLLTPSQDALLRLEQYSFDELSRRFLGGFRISDTGYGIAVRGLLTLAKSRDCFRPSGCSRVSHVLLPHMPDDPNVTDATVVVVGEAAAATDTDLCAPEWFSPGEPLDVHTLADRLVPNAKNRLHLFASAETEGWCSLIDQTNGSHQ